ncbi:MAG: hypothetical protein ABSG74_00740 [Candidatus Bathyarchaeia archaeon]|jgi:hypothetical protein
MKAGSWIFRAWFYFRTGYGTYLTFLLGYVSTLITVYYLAIKNIPFLLYLFPQFGPFALLGTAVGAPTAVVIGWVHMKRSRLYSSEIDVGVEANPYNYKLPPGYTKETTIPSTLIQLRLIRRMSEKMGVLTDSERMELDKLERDYSILLEGGYVGSRKT